MLFRSTRGPLAIPGTYTVHVALAGDTVTGTVVVRKDPHSAGSDQDVRAQATLALELRGDLNRTVDMINRIEWVKKQLADVRAVLQDSSTDTGNVPVKDLLDAAKGVEDSAVAVERALYDVNLTGAREDSFRAPMRLYGRLAALLSDVAENSADFPPTTQQQEVHDVLHARLDDAARAFQSWVDGTLAAFRARIRAVNLPDVVP